MKRILQYVVIIAAFALAAHISVAFASGAQ